MPIYCLFWVTKTNIKRLDTENIYKLRTHTRTHPFNGPFSGTTRVSRYQKGKTNLDYTEARDSEWQWHQLGHMQVCTSLQTDNHAGTPPLSFLQPGCPSCHPTNSVKALKAKLVKLLLVKLLIFVYLFCCVQKFWWKFPTMWWRLPQSCCTVGIWGPDFPCVIR